MEKLIQLENLKNAIEKKLKKTENPFVVINLKKTSANSYEII